jgi:hypothetical protein
LAITNSNPCGKCLSKQLFTITNSKSVAIKSKLLVIATDLLLVIVNSCLERHLPHGLLFVIANSTSILHACIE